MLNRFMTYRLHSNMYIIKTLVFLFISVSEDKMICYILYNLTMTFYSQDLHFSCSNGRSSHGFQLDSLTLGLTLVGVISLLKSLVSVCNVSL